MTRLLWRSYQAKILFQNWIKKLMREKNIEIKNNITLIQIIRDSVKYSKNLKKMKNHINLYWLSFKYKIFWSKDKNLELLYRVI